MLENENRRFTPDQVNAILRRAIDQKGSNEASLLTYNDLLETARELGIETTQVEAAILEHERVDDIERARQQYVEKQKRKFKEHLRSYIVVNLCLFILDITLSDGSWFYWPLFGWGIGLYFDAASTFFPKEKDIERGALQILQKEDRRRRRTEMEGAKEKKEITISGKQRRFPTVS